MARGSVLDGGADGEAAPHAHALLAVDEERVDLDAQVRLQVALREQQLLVLRLRLLQLAVQVVQRLLQVVHLLHQPAAKSSECSPQQRPNVFH